MGLDNGTRDKSTSYVTKSPKGSDTSSFRICKRPFLYEALFALELQSLILILQLEQNNSPKASIDPFGR